MGLNPSTGPYPALILPLTLDSYLEIGWRNAEGGKEFKPTRVCNSPRYPVQHCMGRELPCRGLTLYLFWSGGRLSFVAPGRETQACGLSQGAAVFSRAALRSTGE